MVITYGTPYGNGRNFLNATGDVAIKYTEWRGPGEAGTARPDGATIVALLSPVQKGLFKTGTKVQVITAKGSYVGTVGGDASFITTGTPYIWLEKGINYTNGERWNAGTVNIYAEPAPIIATKSKKYLVFGIIAAVVIGLLYWKFGKKGKKS